MTDSESQQYELSDHSQAALHNPEAYAGTVRVVGGDGEEVSIQEAAERVRCGPILEREGRWAITDFGIECLALYYPIKSASIHESDWLDHLGDKTWFDAADRRDFSEIWKRGKDMWPDNK